MIEYSRRWLGLAALIPALAMIFIDITILPVALPTIQNNWAQVTLNLSGLRLSKFQDLTRHDPLTQGVSATVLKQISLGSAASKEVLSERSKSTAQSGSSF